MINTEGKGSLGEKWILSDFVKQHVTKFLK
jgi:hypothetical protein